MKKKFRLIFFVLCLAALSGCMFMGDRKVHVSGTVTDELGRPLQGATVRFLGDVEDITDVNGRFLFGGVFPGGRLPLKVTKQGFKPYEGNNKFNFYDVTVTLAGETSHVESKAFWKVLTEDDLKAYQKR